MGTSAAIIDEIQVVDCDTHVIEPYDLWTSRLSAKKWGDRIPHVEWNEERQVDEWWFGDSAVSFGAAGAMAGFDAYPPAMPKRLADAQSYTWDPHERLKLMDRYGIFAQILYPNVSGFGMGRFQRLPDPELALECVRAYNDFLTDFCSTSPDRFIGVSALPFWDVEQTLTEMERCATMGHRGVILGSQPEGFGQPPIGDLHWSPVFAAAQEMNLSINFHIASGDMSKEREAIARARRDPATYAKSTVMFFLGNANAITEIIVSGVCHRFPELKFVSVESGVGWLPFVLDALDWQWKNCGVPQAHPEYDLLPSEYFRRQIYGCFWFEDASVKAAIESLGPDNFYETDFPHPTSMSPGPKSTAVEPGQFIREHLSDLDPVVLRKILNENASRLYNLSPAPH